MTKFQLDCGSTVNALPRENYVHKFKDHEFRHVTASDTTLVMFDKARITPLGQRTVTVVNPKNKLEISC